MTEFGERGHSNEWAFAGVGRTHTSPKAVDHQFGGRGPAVVPGRAVRCGPSLKSASKIGLATEVLLFFHLLRSAPSRKWTSHCFVVSFLFPSRHAFYFMVLLILWSMEKETTVGSSVPTRGSFCPGPSNNPRLNVVTGGKRNESDDQDTQMLHALHVSEGLVLYNSTGKRAKGLGQTNMFLLWVQASRFIWTNIAVKVFQPRCKRP